VRRAEAGEGSFAEDEALYRLYLLEELNAAEEDVRQGRVVTHDEVLAETAKWFTE